MANYEPELMYALDSKSEYADWKNVYNVSGSDVLYCPICLGRVKLWNGQDPERTYKKQKCFHHIDGMCSQESRIHFAYKTWLLKAGSKIKVGEKTYEVVNAEIEKTLHTSYGDYRPDIIIDTSDNKKFFVEIAHTNKKTEDYVLKWDKLGCTVLELDVNEQLLTAKIDGVPEFKVIYSSITGECYIKQYIHSEYDDMITERKVFWKRNELMNYKLQWEKLDQFWRKLQIFYSGKSDINPVVDAFKEMEPSDQRFVCNKMRGKHSIIKYELENNYTDVKDIEKSHLQHISRIIRKLNKEFGYSSCNPLDDTYIFRKNRHVIFKDSVDWEKRSHMYVDDDVTEKDIYEHFHPIMEKYYQEHTVPLRERLKNEELEPNKIKCYINSQIVPQLEKVKNSINNCPNNMWKMSYSVDEYYLDCEIELYLLDEWYKRLYISKEEMCEETYDIRKVVTNEMNRMIELGKRGSDPDYPRIYYTDIRIMEDR